MAQNSDPAKAGKLEAADGRRDPHPAGLIEALRPSDVETVIDPGAGIDVDIQAPVVGEPCA